MEGLGDLVVRIGQQGVGRSHNLQHPLLYVGEWRDCQRYDLHSGVLKGCILLTQLNQLRSVWPSPTFLEEDQNNRPFLQLLFESEETASSAAQSETRCDVRDLRLRSRRGRGSLNLSRLLRGR